MTPRKKPPITAREIASTTAAILREARANRAELKRLLATAEGRQAKLYQSLLRATEWAIKEFSPRRKSA